MEHEATIGNYDLTYSPSNPQDTQNSAEKKRPMGIIKL